MQKVRNSAARHAMRWHADCDQGSHSAQWEDRVRQGRPADRGRAQIAMDYQFHPNNVWDESAARRDSDLTRPTRLDLQRRNPCRIEASPPSTRLPAEGRRTRTADRISSS